MDVACYQSRRIRRAQLNVSTPMKTLTRDDFPTLPIQATAAELRALLQQLPAFALEPEPNEKALLQALQKSVTFSGMLQALYPTHASQFFAAGALAKRQVPQQKFVVEESSIRLSSELPDGGHVGVVGDLEVQGDLDVVAVLVVTGNLVVDGTLSDCGPESRIVVLGDLDCQHLFTDGWVLVGGNVRTRGMIYGHYNDDALEVLGDIEAGIILTNEHSIDPAGAFRVRHQPSEPGVWGDQPLFDLNSNEEHIAEVKQLLGDEILDADGDFNYEFARTVEI